MRPDDNDMDVDKRDEGYAYPVFDENSRINVILSDEIPEHYGLSFVPILSRILNPAGTPPQLHVCLAPSLSKGCKTIRWRVPRSPEMFALLWLDASELQGKDGDEIRRTVTLFMLDHGHTPHSGKAVYRTYLMVKGLHSLQDVDAGLIEYHLAGLEVRLNVHILYSESLEGTATEILRLTTSVLDLYENPQLAYEARITSYLSS